MNPIVFIMMCLMGLFILINAISNSSFVEGKCSDFTMPKGAIEFAYEYMDIKYNVTFVNMTPNRFEDNCERHYWVTDTEGINYRLVWSDMHNKVQLNKTYYSIYYKSGMMNSLWEIHE